MEIVTWMIELTPMSLRTLIMNCVGKQIGIYALPGAKAFVPAISVLPDRIHGNNYPPPETTISGIEIVIHKPRPNATACLGNDSVRTHKWEIFLNQWDNNGNLDEITETLINAFQDNNLRFTNPVFPDYNLDAGIVPYCRVAIIEKTLRTVEDNV